MPSIYPPLNLDEPFDNLSSKMQYSMKQAEVKKSAMGTFAEQYGDKLKRWYFPIPKIAVLIISIQSLVYILQKFGPISISDFLYESMPIRGGEERNYWIYLSFSFYHNTFSHLLLNINLLLLLAKPLECMEIGHPRVRLVIIFLTGGIISGLITVVCQPKFIGCIYGGSSFVYILVGSHLAHAVLQPWAFKIDFKIYFVISFLFLGDVAVTLVTQSAVVLLVHWGSAFSGALMAILLFEFHHMVLDQNYLNMKLLVIKAERRILNVLGFVVHVDHPHKLIYVYLHSLFLLDNKEMLQKAWSYMNDSLRTDLFLRHHPETIACAVSIWLPKLLTCLFFCPPIRALEVVHENRGASIS
uniref:Peptidase S54 rhomboid domain-containing protein n=1 Tax=Ditylenchus dipsaci TaxID=166011 RepID=A0A915DU74_9BILA